MGAFEDQCTIWNKVRKITVLVNFDAMIVGVYRVQMTYRGGITSHSWNGQLNSIAVHAV